MASTNAARQAANDQALSYGIGLHVGDVSYGNIGTGSRLEFTVIGDAANRAARIEAQCKELDRNVLISEEFADAVSRDHFELLGEFTLRGIEGSQRIYTLKPA